MLPGTDTNTDMACVLFSMAFSGPAAIICSSFCGGDGDRVGENIFHKL